jgi:predicted 2-oxoglutarate/Fe(II)-dependent dioxygenase YbiX
MKLLKHQLLEKEMCEELIAIPRTFSPGRYTEGSTYGVDTNFRLTDVATLNDDVFEDFFYTYTTQHLFQHFGLPWQDDVVIRYMYCRYHTGYYLKEHSDQPPDRSKAFPRKRIISASICLTDDYEGGELVLKFGGSAINTKLKAGEMLAFESTTRHEVLPITYGTRDVIVAWITVPSEEYEAEDLERRP